MSSRVSKAVLLCEDQEHERLVIAFLKQCGIRSPGRVLRLRVASKLRAGGNIGWVLDEFPNELRVFRSRQTKAESLLIVVIDADNASVENRRRELNERAERAGLEPIQKDEAIALLVPKRHIETWIRALLGDTVKEDDICKTNKSLTKEEVRQAAQRLYEWSRPNAAPGLTCVLSLSTSLPAWRMIESRLR
jgi:hypothetical protein